MATAGAKIKKLREVRGYSQSYMAVKLRISQTQYSYLESKQKVIAEESIKKITELLGVTADYFTNFEPDELIKNEPLLKERSDIKDIITKNDNTEGNCLDLFVKLRDELRELQREIRELKEILKK